MNAHNNIKLLSLKNPVYRNCVLCFTFEELRRDLGKGDVTTSAIFKKSKNAKAKIISRQAGIFAGRMEIEFFLKNRLRAHFYKKDGQRVRKNQTVCEISGSVRDILKMERVILNLLGRMSGVATFTNKVVKKVSKKNPNILICPTRKTLWSLLDKRACALGGGGTHRLGLYDAVLIKDNHLDILRRNIKSAIRCFGSGRICGRRFICGRAYNSKNINFIEVEVDTSAEALAAARELKNLREQGRLRLPCFLLLDNFSVRAAASALALLEKENLRKGISIEISGNINEKNVAKYAEIKGIDVISMGQLTHSAPMLDFSLEILHAPQ